MPYKNIEDRRKRDHEWYIINRKRMLELSGKRYRANKEKRIADALRWKKLNPDKARKSRIKWMKNNPGKELENCAVSYYISKGLSKIQAKLVVEKWYRFKKQLKVKI